MSKEIVLRRKGGEYLLKLESRQVYAWAKDPEALASGRRLGFQHHARERSVCVCLEFFTLLCKVST